MNFVPNAFLEILAEINREHRRIKAKLLRIQEQLNLIEKRLTKVQRNPHKADLHQAGSASGAGD